MIDTNELRRLAQAATPGPWMLRTAPTSAGLCHIISAADWRGAFIYGDGLRIGVDDSLPKAQELAANARLIAAANPAAISELLDRLEAAEKECDECNRRRLEAADHFAAQTALMKEKYDALRAKVEQMERQKPVAWRYQDVRGRHRYRSYVAGFDVEYRALKPIPLYTLPGAKGE